VVSGVLPVPRCSHCTAVNSFSHSKKSGVDGSQEPRAQAVAISGRRFLAVGSNDEVLSRPHGHATSISAGRRSCPVSVIPVLTLAMGASAISALAKVDGKTPDPPDGRCEHDAADQAS